MDEITKHEFFQDIDFKRLFKKEYKAPISPDIDERVKGVNPFVYKETPGKQYKMIQEFTYNEANETLLLRKKDSLAKL